MRPAHRCTTRAHWVACYIDRFNKTGNLHAEHMALWLLLLIEAFGESSPWNKGAP